MAGDAPLALVVSPSLQGHRLTYCRVLSGLLRDLGRRVVVAGDMCDRDVSGAGLLTDLGRWPGVELLDISGRHEDGRFGAEGLAALLREVGSDTTLLTEADGQIPALAAQRATSGGRLPGRLIGLFIRSTNYIYQSKASLSVRVRRRLRGSARGVVGHRAFHEDLVARDHVLDAALVLDENYAQGHLAGHAWMPDIFRETDEPHPGSEGEADQWAGRVGAFLAEPRRGPVIVYVGAVQQRRGYDMLLRLALEQGGSFVHCGQLDDRDTSEREVVGLREALAARGALLETAAPYLAPETADVFFRAARCVVLPYRGHLGSSGIMLQALAAGRPVLVPDRGLMAWRVRTFGLGDTYRDGDTHDLCRRFRALEAAGPETYVDALRAYMRSFSRAQLRAAIEAAVEGSGPGATLPQTALGRVSA